MLTSNTPPPLITLLQDAAEDGFKALNVLIADIKLDGVAPMGVLGTSLYVIIRRHYTSFQPVYG